MFKRGFIVAGVLASALPLFASAQSACPSLSLGSTGSNVSKLQQFLTKEYSNFTSVTGYFGSITETAVKQWQKEHDIVSSGAPSTTGYGAVGPKTAAAMNISLCVTGPTTGVTNPAASTIGSLVQTLLAQIKTLQDRIAVLKSASATTGVNVPSAAATSQSSALPQTQTQSGTPVDAFLIIGDSNGVGQGDVRSSCSVTSGKVLQYKGGLISTANDPVGNAPSGSAWPCFGQSYYLATGHLVLLIPAAVSGSTQVDAYNQGSGTWDVGGTLYGSSISTMNAALAAARNAGYAPVLRGIISVLASNDGNVLIERGSQQEYENALTAMIARYRTDLGNSILPFYMTQTGTWSDRSDTGPAKVRAGQDSVAAHVPAVDIVFRDALYFKDRGLMGDAVHYNQPGLNDLGRISAANIVLAQSPGPQQHADFSAQSVAGAPLTIKFVAPLSLGADYVDFGDDQSGIMMPERVNGVVQFTVAHTYQNAGTYVAKLKYLIYQPACDIHNSFYLTCNDIHVLGSVSIPVGTVPPVPTTAGVSMSANPQTIQYGGRSIVSWSAPDATSCVLSGPLTDTPNGPVVAVTGTGVGPLTSDSTYTVTCETPAGVRSANLTVYVDSSGITMWANPQNISSGGRTNVYWNAPGATSCTLSGPLTDTPNGPVVSVTDTGVGPLTSTSTYTITCQTSAGQKAVSTTVVVN